jgi:hypothetical protein
LAGTNCSRMVRWYISRAFLLPDIEAFLPSMNARFRHFSCNFFRLNAARGLLRSAANSCSTTRLSSSFAHDVFVNKAVVCFGLDTSTNFRRLVKPDKFIGSFLLVSFRLASEY